MWLQLREFNSLRSPHFVAGSVNGKPPAFEAGFRGSIPRPAAIAGSFSGRIPGSDPGDVGSNPAPAAKVSRGHRPKDRTVRYERTNRGSTPRARTKFSAGRPTAQDTALRTLKLGLESPLVDQFSRCRPTGEVLDCRSRLDGFDSRTPRQVFGGCRLTAGFLVLTQKMRVQLSPALPRGCRLIGQDRCLSSSGCRIVTRRPYQV